MLVRNRSAKQHGSANSPLRMREDEEGEDDRRAGQGVRRPPTRQSRTAVADAGTKEQSQCKRRDALQRRQTNRVISRKINWGGVSVK